MKASGQETPQQVVEEPLAEEAERERTGRPTASCWKPLTGKARRKENGQTQQVAVEPLTGNAHTQQKQERQRLWPNLAEPNWAKTNCGQFHFVPNDFAKPTLVNLGLRHFGHIVARPGWPVFSSNQIQSDHEILHVNMIESRKKFLVHEAEESHQ